MWQQESGLSVLLNDQSDFLRLVVFFLFLTLASGSVVTSVNGEGMSVFTNDEAKPGVGSSMIYIPLGHNPYDRV